MKESEKDGTVKDTSNLVGRIDKSRMGERDEKLKPKKIGKKGDDKSGR
jgi:hypothetical protein